MSGGEVVSPRLARDVAKNTRRMFEQIDRGTKDAARKMGATCKRGCAHCCYLLALITLPDALVVAERVLGFEDWAAWLPRLREAALRCDYDGIRSDNYFDRHIGCVFLGEDNLCRIYSSRPSTCRLHLVISEPIQCAPGAADGGVRSIDFGYVEAQVFASAVATENGIPIVGPIPLLTLAGMALLTQEDPVRHPLVLAAVDGLPSPGEWVEKHGERIKSDRRRRIRELNP